MSYRVWTTDLLTGAKLCHSLPMTVESWESTLGRASVLSGSVSLDAPEDPTPYVQPRRTALWVDAGGPAPAFGGIIWQADPDVDARTLRIAAAGPLSYLERREIRRTLDFVQADQLDIARSLIAYVQSSAAGDIGLQVDPLLSGVLRDRAYSGDENKKVGEALRQLSEVEGGFDYCEQFWYDPASGAPRWGVRFGYPWLGQVLTDTVFVYDDAGGPGVNVTSYTWPANGGASANSLMAIGAGEGSTMLRALAQDDAELAAGFPQLDATSLYKDVTVVETLAGHASEDLRVSSGDRIVPTAVIGGDQAPPLGSYGPGDVARFRLSSAYHRRPHPGIPGWDGWLRIVGVKVVPATAEQRFSVAVTLAPIDDRVGI